MLGAAAGLGVLALAYQAFTAEAREAEKAQEDFLTALAKTPKGALDAINARLDAEREKLTQMEARAAIVPGSPEAAQATELPPTDTQLEEQRRKITKLTIDEAAAERALVKAQNDAVASATHQADVMQLTVMARERAIATGETEHETLLHIAEVTARADAAAAHMDATHTAALVTQRMRIALLNEENGVLQFQLKTFEEFEQVRTDALKFLAEPLTQSALAGIKIPTLGELQAQESARQATVQVSEIEKQGTAAAFGFDQEFFDGVQRGVSEAIAQTPAPGKLDVAAIAASSVAVLGALKSGGAGGFLAAGGGLIQQLGASKAAGGLGIAGLGPIGIGLQFAGGLFSLFDNSAERRHREEMRQLEELSRIRQTLEHRGEPGRTSVTILVNGKEVSGAILDDVLYGIKRAERTNAVPVLPPR